MRNIRLEIEYDGTNYCGWQVQKSSQFSVFSSQSKTIQATIENALKKILQEKISLIASGRTDAGVHALAQVANFKTKSTMALEKLQRGLNSLLPDDIVVTKIQEVDSDFHSRFQAKSKAYRYLILNRRYPSAFLRERAYFYPYPLNLKRMRKEARCLIGKHDFKAFCASGSAVKTTIRTIKKISIKKTNYPLYAKRYTLLSVEIEANGFLYTMVRSIVGTLLEIGRGKLPKGSLKQILLSKERKNAGPTAPPRGLYLTGVKYK